MNVVVIVQARTGSSRLPGKVLLEVAGSTVLERQLERIRAARERFELVVATTVDPADRVIVELCRRRGVECHAGHPTDLLDRHYRIACAKKADAVVKIPSDCPLIDPAIVDRVIAHFRLSDRATDFVSNLHPATYPDGNDVEVVGFRALEAAFREAKRQFEREHTTPFVWERPERFRALNVPWETGKNYSMTHRWTLDYREDYELIRAIYERLWSPSRPIFGLDEILRVLEDEPLLARINARYCGVNWYRHHLDELVHVGPCDTREAI